MFISPNGGSCEKSLDSDAISQGSEISCPAAKHSPMRSFSKSGSVVEVVDCLEKWLGSCSIQKFQSEFTLTKG